MYPSLSTPSCSDKIVRFPSIKSKVGEVNSSNNLHLTIF